MSLKIHVGFFSVWNSGHGWGKHVGTGGHTDGHKGHALSQKTRRSSAAAPQNTDKKVSAAKMSAVKTRWAAVTFQNMCMILTNSWDFEP